MINAVPLSMLSGAGAPPAPPGAVPLGSLGIDRSAEHMQDRAGRLQDRAERMQDRTERRAAAPGWQGRYAMPDWQSLLTKFNPGNEANFQQWATHNNAPTTPDYDMRGFWNSGGAMQTDPNDGRQRFPEAFKTPLHPSFSGESMFANPHSNPPMWNGSGQLADHTGNVFFDRGAGG